MHYLLPVLPAVVVVQSESVRRSVVLLSPACCSTSPVTVVSPDPLHCLPPVSAQYVSLQYPTKIAATKVAHAKVCRHAPYAPYHAKQALCIVSSLSVYTYVYIMLLVFPHGIRSYASPTCRQRSSNWPSRAANETYLRLEMPET